MVQCSNKWTGRQARGTSDSRAGARRSHCDQPTRVESRHKNRQNARNGYWDGNSRERQAKVPRREDSRDPSSLRHTRVRLDDNPASKRRAMLKPRVELRGREEPPLGYNAASRDGRVERRENRAVHRGVRDDEPSASYDDESCEESVSLEEEEEDNSIADDADKSLGSESPEEEVVEEPLDEPPTRGRSRRPNSHPKRKSRAASRHGETAQKERLPSSHRKEVTTRSGTIPDRRVSKAVEDTAAVKAKSKAAPAVDHRAFQRGVQDNDANFRLPDLSPPPPSASKRKRRRKMRENRVPSNDEEDKRRFAEDIEEKRRQEQAELERIEQERQKREEEKRRLAEQEKRRKDEEKKRQEERRKKQEEEKNRLEEERIKEEKIKRLEHKKRQEEEGRRREEEARKIILEEERRKKLEEERRKEKEREEERRREKEREEERRREKERDDDRRRDRHREDDRRKDRDRDRDRDDDRRRDRDRDDGRRPRDRDDDRRRGRDREDDGRRERRRDDDDRRERSQERRRDAEKRAEEERNREEERSRAEAERERLRLQKKAQRLAIQANKEENEPTSVVVVRGVPPGLTEERLEAIAWEISVRAGGSMPNGVRLQDDTESPEPLVNALIEFPHVDAAKLFKELGSGQLEVDSRKFPLKYFHQEAARSRSPSCNITNGRDRDGDRDVPSVTILLKGIPSTADEGKLAATFHPFASVKDIRYFPKRCFAFIQFHTIADSENALKGFHSACKSRIDGQRIVAHFAKERQDGRPMASDPAALLELQINAQLEATAQTSVHESASKALTGVNAQMWANYVQTVSQTGVTETTASEGFQYDQDSGFYLDRSVGLYYDPTSTYFFTMDYQKYFVYCHEERQLCLVSKDGKKVPDGERRPLPNQPGQQGTKLDGVSDVNISTGTSWTSSSGLVVNIGGAAADEPTVPARSRERGEDRKRRDRSSGRGWDRRRSRSRRDRRRSRSRSRAKRDAREADLTAAQAAAHGVPLGAEGVVHSIAPVAQVDQQSSVPGSIQPLVPPIISPDMLKPIHFPGGDPLAMLAPSPQPAPAQPAKKKKKPQIDGVLGLAQMTKSGAAIPGRVTVYQPAPSKVVMKKDTASVAAFSGGLDIVNPKRDYAAAKREGTSKASRAAPAPDGFICEICCRKFSTQDALERHEQLSELHKENLAKMAG